MIVYATLHSQAQGAIRQMIKNRTSMVSLDKVEHREILRKEFVPLLRSAKGDINARYQSVSLRHRFPSHR